MREPLFKVGEEVILQDPLRPEISEECYIVDLLYGYFRNTTTKESAYQFGYKVNIEDVWWPEKTIRKKYPPSTLSYKELLADLKQIKV